MLRIIPRYKLMIQYNIKRETHEAYYQFVTEELVPGLQGMGLYMFRIYHTAYGEHPVRQLEFLAEDLDTVRQAFASDAWKRLEDKLSTYVTEYSRKLVHFRDGFQI